MNPPIVPQFMWEACSRKRREAIEALRLDIARLEAMTPETFAIECGLTFTPNDPEWPRVRFVAARRFAAWVTKDNVEHAHFTFSETERTRLYLSFKPGPGSPGGISGKLVTSDLEVVGK